MFHYTCQYCQKSFESRRPPQDKNAPRYCTRQCADNARRKHKPRICKICGNTYLPYYRGQKYCGQECKFEAHRREGFVNCAYCGNPFKRSKRAIKYCSQRCYGNSLLSPFPRKGKEFTRAVRRAIRERDGYVCVVCGSATHLEIDHIIPVSLGGDNSITNGQTLCHDCHRQKSLRQRRVILSRHLLRGVASNHPPEI